MTVIELPVTGLLRLLTDLRQLTTMDWFWNCPQTFQPKVPGTLPKADNQMSHLYDPSSYLCFGLELSL